MNCIMRARYLHIYARILLSCTLGNMFLSILVWGFLLRWEVSDPELVLLMGKMVVYLSYLSFILTITQQSEY
jgi:hypothetical protein